MARYFIGTTNHVMVIDDEGVELSSHEALRDMLRVVLSEMLRDEANIGEASEMSAHAYLESGALVMSAKVAFTIAAG